MLLGGANLLGIVAPPPGRVGGAPASLPPSGYACVITLCLALTCDSAFVTSANVAFVTTRYDRQVFNDRSKADDYASYSIVYRTTSK